MEPAADPFQKQLKIDNWSQEKIAAQSVLVLGVGGLGTWVAQSLCRLGVGRVILLDFDVVEVSNLNRQILYSPKDVGKIKAEVAAECLIERHCINPLTKVEWHNYCALKNWSKVVNLAKQATAVFNLIDYGDHFDAAVQSLCLKLQLPLFLGGTMNQSLSIDIFPTKPGTQCFGCISDNLKEEVVAKITQDKILELEDISFLPKDDHPPGISNTYLAATAANILVAQFSSILLNDPDVKLKQRILGTINDCDLLGWGDIERDRSCTLCEFVYVPPPPKQEEEKKNDEKEQAKEENQAEPEAKKEENSEKAEPEVEAEGQNQRNDDKEKAPIIDSGLNAFIDENPELLNNPNKANFPPAEFNEDLQKFSLSWKKAVEDMEQKSGGAQAGQPGAQKN